MKLGKFSEKFHNWLHEPVGGWNKFWHREVTIYSKVAQKAIHDAVQAYLIKWNIYYHETEEYDLNLALDLEVRITKFLEDTCRINCK